MAKGVALSLGLTTDFIKGLAKRDEVFSALNDVRVTRQYESSIFNGASIETEAYNADDLLGLPEVARVWPNQYYNIAAYKSTRQSSGLDPADYDVHNATGVRELHEMGIRGKGAKVAVVDTGVDYNHPAVSDRRFSIMLRNGLIEYFDHSLAVASVKDSK